VSAESFWLLKNKQGSKLQIKMRGFTGSIRLRVSYIHHSWKRKGKRKMKQKEDLALEFLILEK